MEGRKERRTHALSRVRAGRAISRLADLDLALTELANLVDLGSRLADDGPCLDDHFSSPPFLPHEIRLGQLTDQLVRNEDLLSLLSGQRSRGWSSSSSSARRRTAVGPPSSSSASSSTATASVLGSSSSSSLVRRVRSSCRAVRGVLRDAGGRVLLKDRADVVDGDVDGVGNSRDREDTLLTTYQ